MTKGKTLFAALAAVSAAAISAQAQSWIWHPGEFDNWLAKKTQCAVTYKGTLNPPRWPLFDPVRKTTFTKTVTLDEPETISIYADGNFDVQTVEIDGDKRTPKPYGGERKIPLGKGTTQITISVENNEAAPALFVKGKTVVSDKSWKTSIDGGEANAETYSRGFDNHRKPPSQFALKRERRKAASQKKESGTIFADFGKETFGFIVLKGARGKGKITVYYGESEVEAYADDNWEVISFVDFDSKKKTDYTLPDGQGFRYARIVPEDGVKIDSVEMDFEYLDIPERGSFECSDELLNKIWDISYYTLFLTAREYFVDGIKRDRWMWSGDATQSYLMNYYSYFDTDTAKRTMWGLRGKDPLTCHINTILDYSFYWLDSVHTYYLYTKDIDFVKAVYPRMVSLAEYCLERRNAEGFVSHEGNGWVFIDWANIDNSGVVSTEQILFGRALESTAKCAELVGDNETAKKYSEISKELLKKSDELFWNDKKGAYVHKLYEGKLSDQVTRHANMFATLFGYLDGEKLEKVKKMLTGREIEPITTPYMRFYELDALCDIGQHDFVLDEIRAYWGGMLELGATSFWEVFNPAEDNHTHMYGRPFGRSFCHSWGATALYIFGRHFAGVKPLTPGYETFEIAPHLSDLDWIKAKVPTPNGDIVLNVTKKSIEVESPGGVGYLRFESKSEPKCAQGEIKKTSANSYELEILPNKKYAVTYEK